MSLADVFSRFLPLIEKELQEVAGTPHPNLAHYYGMMHYHLGWLDDSLKPVAAKSGKRLRPILCLLACEAANGDPLQALPAAAALELVHNFSLVHDDIQDGSLTRRGRRAVWSIWGPAHGINVGDGLFVLARLGLNRLGQQQVPAQRRLAAMETLDRACMSLCEGQFFDMMFEERMDVDLEQYLWMIRHKTAALLSAAMRLGALVASDDPDVIAGLAGFGENLGMAFQIQDDILGVWGDEKVTGKSAATDIRDKKKTLLVIYVLNHPQERHSAWQLTDLYSREDPLDQKAMDIVLDILERTRARAYAEEMAESYHAKALASLEGTGLHNPALDHLRELAASLLGREV